MTSTPQQTSAHAASQPDRYPALRGIATLCRVLAIASAAVAVLMFFALASMQAEAGVLLACVVSGVIAVVLFLVLAEGTRVVVDIEHNTRMAAEAMRQIVGRDQTGSR